MHNFKCKKARIVLSLLLTVVMLFSVIAVGTATMSAETSTGIGLCAHSLRAYNEGWPYVWGAMTEGAVDCSGMIMLYNGVGGIRTDMLGYSQQTGLDWGYVSNGVPRIHGLGLHKPGHVGVYVGSGLAIDARGTNWGIIYGSLDAVSWVEWFKISGVSYPTTGWVRFDGKSFYYENGQYIVNTSRTFDGVTYTFGSSGASDIDPPESSYEVTDYSNTKVTSNSSSGSSYLKVGSQGSKVEEVQQKLKDLGYFDDDVTGYYGTYTAACVKEFQEAAGIEVDGVVGPEFLQAINSSSAPRKGGAASTSDNNTSSENEDDTYVPEETATEAPTEAITEAPTEAPTEAETQAPTEEATQAATEAPTETPTEAPTAAPTEPPTIDDGTLRYGDSGSDVADFQNRLKELGFLTGNVTGIFDDNTLSALHAYFTASDMRAYDEITKEQLDVLYSTAAVTAPSKQVVSNENSAEVIALQDDLVRLGYMNSATGTYDTETENAVKIAQSNFALEVTGQANDEFMEALDLEAARQDSQVVESAVVNSVQTNDGALSPNTNGAFTDISNDAENNGSMALIWVAGAMLILGTGATAAYIVHRKTRIKTSAK